MILVSWIYQNDVKRIQSQYHRSPSLSPEWGNYTLWLIHYLVGKFYWSCIQYADTLSVCKIYLSSKYWKQTQCYTKQGKSEGFDSCDRPNNLTQIGFKLSIFQTVWPWNLMDDPKKNRAPLLYWIKLCASFHIHQWIQTGVTVWKHPICVKIDDLFSRVTLQFDLWPWKTIRQLFFATSSFVHHFVAIGELKLELQSGNAQFG